MRVQNSIFICGFMGVGKSTVGRILSQKLQIPFFETDSAIVEKAGKPITSIFKDDGEAFFRRLEEEVLASLESSEPMVVSLGGGTLGSEKNQAVVHRAGVLVYLRANLETLIARLEKEASGRPLLAGLSSDDRIKKVQSLLKERETVYSQADFHVKTDGRTPTDVADEIIHCLRHLTRGN